MVGKKKEHGKKEGKHKTKKTNKNAKIWNEAWDQAPL
jgi:hypothetical protein